MTDTLTKGTEAMVDGDYRDITLNQVVGLEKAIATTACHPRATMEKHDGGLRVKILWRLRDLRERAVTKCKT